MEVILFFLKLKNTSQMSKKKFQRVSFKDAEKMLKKHIYEAKRGQAMEVNNCPNGYFIYLADDYVLKLIKKLTR